MIEYLDRTIWRLFADQSWISGVEVSFNLPNRDWSSRLKQPCINIYLFDIKVAISPDSPYQARIDFLYRITAFAHDIADEHRLLSRILAVLRKYPVLPAEVPEGVVQFGEIRAAIIGRQSASPDTSALWEAMDNESRPSIDYKISMNTSIGSSEFLPPLKQTGFLEISELGEFIKLLLIEEIPLRSGEVHILFDPPKREWQVRLSKPTVNIYLYDINIDTDAEFDLSFKISVFAGDPEDEHLLLGRVLLALLQHPIRLVEKDKEIRTVYPSEGYSVQDTARFWIALDNWIRPTIDYHLTLVEKSWESVETQPETADVPRARTPAGISTPPSSPLTGTDESRPITDKQGMEAREEAVHAPQLQWQRLSIFLCHSSGDKPRVRGLYHRLLEDDFDPWLDEENLLPGQEWEQEIPRAVRASDVVIVCLTKSSVGKTGYIQKEIRYALDVAEEQPEDTIYIIPLRLEECEVPKRLSKWQWVDLFEEKGYERLLRSLYHRLNAIRR